MSGAEEPETDWCDVCWSPQYILAERAEPIADETRPLTAVYTLACGHEVEGH